MQKKQKIKKIKSFIQDAKIYLNDYDQIAKKAIGIFLIERHYMIL